MNRKIIQFTVMPYGFFGWTTGYRQHALCDDGTLWYRDAIAKDSSWHLVADKIPPAAP